MSRQTPINAVYYKGAWYATTEDGHLLHYPTHPGMDPNPHTWEWTDVTDLYPDVCQAVNEALGTNLKPNVTLDTIPCATCGEPVYDDEDNAHVKTGRIPCPDEPGGTA